MRRFAANIALGAVYITTWITFRILRIMCEIVIFIFPRTLGVKHVPVRSRRRR